ncbi:hypothetical protein NMY22_g8152 [Coprinellus aureogranulatus]|nr:hypothetical protein NMY22_g8152 [Coprinellus aureogranulatus]
MKIIKYPKSTKMPSPSKPSSQAAKQELGKVLDPSLCPVCTASAHIPTCPTERSAAELNCTTGTNASSRATAVQLPASHSSGPGGKPYSALWVKYSGNGLTAQLQRMNNSDRMRVIVDSRTPFLVLIDNEAAVCAFAIFLSVTFGWLALKGLIGIV